VGTFSEGPKAVILPKDCRSHRIGPGGGVSAESTADSSPFLGPRKLRIATPGSESMPSLLTKSTEEPRHLIRPAKTELSPRKGTKGTWVSEASVTGTRLTALYDIDAYHSIRVFPESRHYRSSPSFRGGAPGPGTRKDPLEQSGQPGHEGVKRSTAEVVDQVGSAFKPTGRGVIHEQLMFTPCHGSFAGIAKVSRRGRPPAHSDSIGAIDEASVSEVLMPPAAGSKGRGECSPAPTNAVREVLAGTSPEAAARELESFLGGRRRRGNGHWATSSPVGSPANSRSGSPGRSQAGQHQSVLSWNVIGAVDFARADSPGASPDGPGGSAGVTTRRTSPEARREAVTFHRHGWSLPAEGDEKQYRKREANAFRDQVSSRTRWRH